MKHLSQWHNPESCHEDKDLTECNKMTQCTGKTICCSDLVKWVSTLSDKEQMRRNIFLWKTKIVLPFCPMQSELKDIFFLWLSSSTNLTMSAFRSSFNDIRYIPTRKYISLVLKILIIYMNLFYSVTSSQVCEPFLLNTFGRSLVTCFLLNYHAH